MSLDGTVRYEAHYVFRRNALEDAGRLSSVVYDVLVEDTKGKHRPLIWPHTPPEVLLRRLEERPFVPLQRQTDLLGRDREEP